MLNISDKKQEKLLNIQIPEHQEKKIKKRIGGTGFNSVSAYITYVLEEIMSDMDEDKDDTFTEEDEEKVKERLRSLGYLD